MERVKDKAKGQRGGGGDQGGAQGVRMPPQSIEAEQAVLGSILLDNEAIDLVLEILENEDFYSEVNRQVFEIMKALYADGQPIDTTTLYARLHQSRAIQSAGGVHYLLQLTDRVPSATSARHYAQIVAEKATLRKLIQVTGEAQEGAYGDVENVTDFVNDLERQVFGLARADAKQAFFSMREVIKTTFVQIENLYERKEAVTGTTTGYVDLDEMTAGWQPSDLIILAARPSMGKTALALNFVANAAVHSGVPTAFFSLEMSKEQLAMRLLCCEARIDASRLRSGFLTEQEWSRLIKAAGALSESPIYIDDTPSLPIMKMQAKVRRLKAERGLGLIVVDYLQLMKGDPRSNSREQEIADISRNLKAVAKELDLPVISLSQLNRGVDSRTDKRPMLSDLRESGSIEQDADIIMFIYRDEVYNKETTEKGIAEVIISKQRNGAIGTVKLKWFGMYTRFENLAREEGGHPF